MQDFQLKISKKTKALNFFRTIFKIRFFETFLAGRTQNKSLDTFLAKCIPPNYLYRKKSLRKVERDELKFELDLSDVVDHFIFFGLKDLQREKLYSFIKTGMNVVDVGANMGDTALHFSNLTGKTGRVFAFEPDPLNFLRASKNISMNKINNVQLFKVGLGNENKTLKLYQVNEGNKGMNRILNDESNYSHSEIKVEKLDDFVASNKINNVDLIKIDVEGFEMNVLKGAYQTLKNKRPILFIELDNENLKEQDSSASALISYLIELKYDIYDAETSESLNPKKNYTNCHFDIYALPK